ncbi:MAG: hypothetical protein P8R36_06545 [Actinomycetota bacterium]|nr:hypothetical protein [Actinomycetota bacterium]MDG1489930.1 hypothetical protein [Actinomycetota bacterium]MDG2120937.1 hypothetical protein [Actinomycetota bacterium]
MSPIAFLGIAAVIACLGLLVIGLRGRRRDPWDAGIKEFRKKLDALSAEAEIKTSTVIDDDEGRQSSVT